MNATVVVKTLTAAKKATLSSYPSDSGLWLKSGTAPISSTSPVPQNLPMKNVTAEKKALVTNPEQSWPIPETAYISFTSPAPQNLPLKNVTAEKKPTVVNSKKSWPLPQTAYISFTSPVPENLPVKNVYTEKKPLIVKSERSWPLPETASICFIAPIDDLPLKTVSARTEPVLTSYPLESGLPWLKSESASICLMASMPSVSDIPQHIPALAVVNEDKLENKNDVSLSVSFSECLSLHECLTKQIPRQKLEKENRPTTILNTVHDLDAHTKSVFVSAGTAAQQRRRKGKMVAGDVKEKRRVLGGFENFCPYGEFVPISVFVLFVSD
ncbi:hypothetical protein K435DRAFT_315571 [Dendrothele bispora CBS 962.96]|uniref:Uncharacterized protein n=1 Tax=Dendrothele bispora (strain CBS 962.96) TaxID=1314807 RepID=A0A4S8LHM6_DENBC|nr:hypothetical protein K435DRAFT_315571 [Dendrothele bispora CBS 962.96]